MTKFEELSRVGELEFDEVKELEQKFKFDLELVFEGKELEFGDHLRGMLFDLWSRARNNKTEIAKELEELRQLKASRSELEQLIDDRIKAALPLAGDQMAAEARLVFETELEMRLRTVLENPVDLDRSLAVALERVINPGDGLEHELGVDRLTISRDPDQAAFSPLKYDPHGSPDPVQTWLRERLRYEGLLPTDDFHESWNWAPMYFNTQTGEKAAWDNHNWRERFNIDPEERLMPLAGDGFNWYFPSPRPVGDQNNTDAITLFVNDVEVPRLDYPMFQWSFEWDMLRNENVITAVANLSVHVNPGDRVEARYRIIEKTQL
jgi:hypothetical protein